jgi:hypothetical protein
MLKSPPPPALTVQGVPKPPVPVAIVNSTAVCTLTETFKVVASVLTAVPEVAANPVRADRATSNTVAILVIRRFIVFSFSRFLIAVAFTLCLTSGLSAKKV